MKTRILALLVALICLFSLAACKKDTPYSLYTDATKKLDAATGFEAKVTMDIKMVSGSSENTMKNVMDVKQNGNNISLVNEDMSIVYVDGTMYISMDDTKIKSTVSLEDFKEDYGSVSDLELISLTEDDFKDIELKKDGDVRSFTVKVSGDKVKQYILELMGEDSDEDVSIGDLELTCFFNKDADLTKMIMVVSVTDTENADNKMDLTITYEFTNPGTVPAVAAPADADQYTESDFD